MQFIEAESYTALSKKAAGILAAAVTAKPNSVLGLATGSSVLGIYAQLIEWCRGGDLDFSGVSSVNLDEYISLDGSHPASYRYYMEHNFFRHIHIDPANTFVPSGVAADIDAECQRYDAILRSLGRIDVQLLGIGLDGHIGFNEPCDHFVANTHAVELHPSTIAANARFFADSADVPRRAITMGIAPMVQAKKVLLVANGQAKKDILHKAFFGPITPYVPASILQLHPDVTVIYSEN